MEDNSNLKKIITESVNQLKSEMELFNQLNITRRPFNKIIFCGMGGSGLIGEFFKYFKTKKYLPMSANIPIFIHRSYGLPAEADENSLIICISYSGQTEETISSFNQAKEKNLEITGISCGGKLAEIFQTEKIPWIKIPESNMPPRFSLGYQLKAAIKIFTAYGILPFSAQKEILLIPEKIKPIEIEKNAEKECLKLIDKIPIIYTSQENKIIGYLWKIQFNENAKIPAFCNYFPELNHNEFAGWQKNSKTPFHFLFLKDKNDLPPIKKRMDLTEKILQESEFSVNSFVIEGENALENIFWALCYGDWLSYYLALARQIDPAPVKIIEDFKKQLKSDF